MPVIKMTDLDLAGKRVLICADLNVPVKDGKVTSDARIVATLLTTLALEKGRQADDHSPHLRPTEVNNNEEFLPGSGRQPSERRSVPVRFAWSRITWMA